ncbi:MAG: CoA-binding protein [Deltaproteobacteria bacterium]|nr:CoA-binding protein [Deltaproteobacteria bacterium]
MDISDHPLHKFFYPESVALIGASANPVKPSYNLIGNQLKLGYQGRMYPVHPTEKEILGLKVYPSVGSIEETVDLAVITVPHVQAPRILQECIEKGIRRVILVAGGFSETGEKGRKVQQRMLELVRKNGVRALGPNALSPINPRHHFAISFHSIDRLKTGGLSLIFQSGLYEPRLRWMFSAFNLHLNKLLDLGNKMDLNEVDALSYLVFDPLTRVIGLHLESIEGEGRQFLDLIRQASDLGKRVVVLKSGRTEEGAKAAASHTGVMVQGNDRVLDRLLKQCGAIRAYTVEEFFDLARALERFGTLTLKGDRIAVATLPGGEAVIMTDLVQQEGMKMARANQSTINKLKSISPPWEISANPFDLGVALQFNNSISVYETLVAALSEDENIDALHLQIPEQILFLPREQFEMFHRAPALGKPLALWVAGVESGTYENLQWLEDQGIPVFPSPEKAIRALSALHQLSKYGP